MPVGSPTTQPNGIAGSRCAQVVEQARHALAADLLVVAQREVDRRARAAARASPAPAPAPPRRSPSCRRCRGRAGGRRARRRRTGRSTSPGRRPAPRRYGRTARGRRARAARSWRTGWPCAPVSSKTSVRGDAQAVEVVAHEIDQREVGVATGGVEGDQPRQHLAHGQTACARHVLLADRAGGRGARTIGAQAAPLSCLPARSVTNRAGRICPARDARHIEAVLGGELRGCDC